ncbi:uncharacterized protein EV422DRAFT_272191 [Fimicolochytrium jonesii]|uniref:uncharacterized protein n=1 Tax=Fimicolochytrium jonesii TaxID=1396493 RepID=UPI0022FDD7C9|nr:uncharacterized protein EV422DRAFT_272191 [Fimicolochytrium jonesii]KAI8816850.1 hypothetical protein EV422DRAFT_272191 [Fimicolochytrium jonesii]
MSFDWQCYRYSNSIVPDVVITDPRLLKPIWDVPTSNDDVEELEGLGRDRWQGQEIQGSDDEGWDDGRRGGEDEDPEQGWAGGQGPGRQDDDEWQDGSRTSNSDTDASRKRRRRPQQADDQWQDEDRRRGSQRLSASRDWRANLNLAAFPSPRDDQSRPNQSGRPAPGLDGSPPWMQGSGQPGDDQRQQQQEQEQSGGRDPFFASGNWGQGQSDNQWQDGRGGAEPNWTPSSQRPSNNDQWDPTNRPMGGNNDVPPRGGSNDSRGGTPQDAPPRRPDGGSNDGSRNPSNTPNTSRAPPHTGPSNGGAPTPSQGQPASTNPNANPSTPKDPNFTPLPFTNGLRRRASSSFVIGDVMQMYREKKLRSSSANTASVEKRGEHRYFAGYGAHGHPTNKHTPHALDRSDYFNLRHHGEVSRQVRFEATYTR